MEVAELSGTPDEKFEYLVAQCDPPLNLHNRPAPSPEEIDMMEEILESRHGGRLPHAELGMLDLVKALNPDASPALEARTAPPAAAIRSLDLTPQLAS